MRPHVVAWLSQFLPARVAQLLAPGWFTCVGLAGVVGLWLVLRTGKRAGIERSVVASAVLWGYLAAVIAGIAMPMLIDCAQQQILHGHVAVRWAGMTSFWGYLFGMAAIAIVCRDHRVPVAQFADVAAIPMGAALFVSRIGCFLGGCDYGKVSNSWFALRFPAGSPAWRDHVAAGLVPASRSESLPVHPTQLYESAVGIAILAVSILVARTAWAKRAHGRVFACAAATYAIGRLGVEALRGDAERGIYAGLSSGQIFCLLVLLAVGAGLLVAHRRAVALVAAGIALCVAMPRAARAQPAPQNPYEAPPAAPLFRFDAGLLAGIAVPLNRHTDQVPTLAGFTLSFGANLVRDQIGVWFDYDTFANTEATHGTFLLSGSYAQPVSDRLRFGTRIGIGPTLVNFKDPAFRDVSGLTTRLEATVEYGRNNWVLWARPISFDLLTASELGGPIFTWQLRVGAAYRFGARSAQ